MNREILRLAIPNIVTSITVPLLSLVDMALMGHLDSEVYIGAIALGGVVFNFLYWMFSFLRMGASGFTAQAYGQNNREEIRLLLGRSMCIAVLSGILLIILQHPIAWVAFTLLEGSPEVKALAGEYFFVRIWAAPATIGLYSLTGWLIGMQNAKIPMAIALIVNVINIVLSMLFVLVFNMQSAGVALSTVISQYAGLFIGIVFLVKRFRKDLPQSLLQSLLDIKGLKRFLSVNGDIFIRTLCIIGVFTFFTSKSAGTGDITLAVNSILLQFLMFFSFFMDGFAHAGEAITGKYFGALNRGRLIHLIKNLFGWGVFLAVAYSTAYFFAGNVIVSLLTDSAQIKDHILPFLWWAAIIPLTSFTAFIWDGIFIGAIASKGMRNSMLIATFLLFIPIYYLLHERLGNHALWLAINIFFFGRGVLQTLMARTHIYNRLPLKG